MYKLVRIVIMASALLTAVHLKAQEPQPQNLDNYKGMSANVVRSDTDFDDLSELPDISKWLPVEKFAEEIQAVQTIRFAKSTFSTYMVIPKRKINVVVVSPDNNSVKFGQHFTISNGNASNLGIIYPSALLDARTLSFPAPR